MPPLPSKAAQPWPTHGRARNRRRCRDMMRFPAWTTGGRDWRRGCNADPSARLARRAHRRAVLSRVSNEPGRGESAARLRDRIKDQARALGLDAVGVASARDAWPAGAHLQAFLDDG